MNLLASIGVGPKTTRHYRSPLAPLDTAAQAKWEKHEQRTPDVQSTRTGRNQRLPSGPGSRRTREECVDVARKARALMKANPRMKQGEIAKQLKLSAQNLSQILARHKTP